MWLLDKEEITSIEQIPEKAIGFVYMVHFVDGTKYIGKKNLYSITKVKALKSGKKRDNVIGKELRNTGKGFREAYDIIKKESNWFKYQGSSKECETRIVDKKYILQYAYSKLELTYLEAKMLFTYEVLEKSDFLNDNILGSFYKNDLS